MVGEEKEKLKGKTHVKGLRRGNKSKCSKREQLSFLIACTLASLFPGSVRSGSACPGGLSKAQRSEREDTQEET